MWRNFLRLLLAGAVLATIVSCAGSGTTVVVPTESFTELQWTSVTTSIPTISGISNTGVAVGSGLISSINPVHRVALVWKNLVPVITEPNVGSEHSSLLTISPNGKYANGWLRMGFRDDLVYRVNLEDQTTAICVPPQYYTFASIYPMQTSDTGTTTGMAETDLSYNYYGNYLFTYTSGDNIDLVRKSSSYDKLFLDYFSDVSLLLPPGTTSLEPTSYSHNRQFVAGKAGTHGCIWNVAAHSVTTIDAAQGGSLCKATMVSDTGDTAICEIDTSYLWDPQNGLRKAIDYLHSRGFAQVYSSATVTALSADGKYFAGTLGDGTQDYVTFAYRFP